LVERVVVVERIGVEVDDLARDLVLVRAAVAAHVGGLAEQVHGAPPVFETLNSWV
jgi:hypothetical protein